MNFQEIIEELKKQDILVSEFVYQDFTTPLPVIGECKEVDRYGGEGMGETLYSVKFFPDHNVYVRVDGYYTSYNGTDFDGWESVKEVRPQEKTITVYEAL